MIHEIPWEKDRTGTSAFLKILEQLKINPALSKKIALLKMTEITIISGVFQGAHLYFYPLAWALFDSSDKLEFCGVYSRELNEDETELTNLPSICVRKSVWIKAKDRQALVSATNIEEYIKDYLFTEASINSTNFFVKSSDCQAVLLLVSDLLSQMKQGVKLEESNLAQPEFEEIRYCLADDFFNYKLGYTPYKLKSEALEEWGVRWRNYFREFEFNNDFLSEEKYQISYSSSFIDYFKRFLSL